jgi:hypothetical protein
MKRIIKELRLTLAVWLFGHCGLMFASIAPIGTPERSLMLQTVSWFANSLHEQMTGKPLME